MVRILARARVFKEDARYHALTATGNSMKADQSQLTNSAMVVDIDGQFHRSTSITQNCSSVGRRSGGILECKSDEDCLDTDYMKAANVRNFMKH